MRFLKQVWAIVEMLLGIATPKHQWKWIGEPGWPRWELDFDHEGFAFRAVLTHALNRPTYFGRFASFPAPDSVTLDGKAHFIPARNPAVVKDEFIQSGMSAAQAERAWRKLIQVEAQTADDYERGYASAYSAVVTVKRGRTVLASKTTESILMDPSMLIYGGEEHVTRAVMDLREPLTAAALTELKCMAAPVVHFG